MTIIPDALYTIWLPIAITLLFGLLGFLRGLWREAVVSAAIVIGALIVQQWATPDRWVQDIGEVINNAEPGWIQFILSAAILLPTVLLVGYLLGTRLVSGPLSASSRWAGAFLGLANGSALAGWLLRYAYVGLDRTEALGNDASAQGFMIWAGWFPVALAVLGALVGLLAPLRSAQTVIAQPSPQTDWAPSAQARASAPQTPPILTTTPDLSAHTTPSPYMPASAPASTYSPPNRSLDRSETTVLPITDAGRPAPGFDSPTRSATPIVPPRSVESRPARSIYEQPTEMVPRIGHTASSTPADQTSTGTTPSARSDAQPQLMAESSTPGGPFAGSTTASRGLGGDIRRCVRCGTELPPDGAFCTECGLRVSA